MLLDDFRCDEGGDLFTEDAEWISNYGIYERADGKQSLHLSSPALIDISGAAASAWWISWFCTPTRTDSRSAPPGGFMLNSSNRTTFGAFQNV